MKPPLPPSLNRPVSSYPLQNMLISLIDLSKIPVGNMANIVKAAKRAGHAPYTPIDVTQYASLVNPHVEPGRVEARVSEFYSQLESIMNPRSHDGRRAEAERERHDQRRESKREKEEDVWEKYVPGYEESKELDVDRARPRKQARHVTTREEPLASVESEISEDNLGHKLLRGLGWQQGSGLGADNSGIVAPINAKPAADRVAGIGMNSSEPETLVAGSIDYAAYRKQLSSQYHTRMAER